MRRLIVPLGVIITLILFKINILAGFGFVIGLCAGSLLEKFGLNEKN